MVKELKVRDEREAFSPEREETLLHEFVYLGIELPEELTNLRRERLGWVPADRTPDAVKAEAAWTAYKVWMEGHPEHSELSPAQRLAAYVAELGT